MSEGKKRDRIGVFLTLLYAVLLVASLLVIGKLVYLQVVFRPNPKIATALTPKRQTRRLEPVRGSIVDCNGRLLAMSYPVYDIHMDCTVRKAEFSKIRDKDSAMVKEQNWLLKARSLSDGLAEVVPGKTGEQY